MEVERDLDHSTLQGVRTAVANRKRMPDGMNLGAAKSTVQIGGTTLADKLYNDKSLLV